MNIIQAFDDPELLGKFFRPRFMRSDTWAPWRTLLSTVFALPMTDEQKAMAFRHTGRKPPVEPAREVFLAIGRRGGKSRVASAVAVFLATFYNYESLLAAGERGIVLLVAPDKKQSKVLLNYCAGFVHGIPMIERLIIRETADGINFSNNISIEIRTGSYRSIRGTTTVAAVVDEAAFLPTDLSAEPDTELLTALRPSMSTIPTSLLLVISTPYRRAGELYRAYRANFGKETQALFWNASSLVMNAALSQKVVEAAFQSDPVGAASEFGRNGFVEFRNDVAAFLPREAIEACVVRGRRELPPLHNVTYTAFGDPSGAASDAFGYAIAHSDRGRLIVDLARQVCPPFSPDLVVEEITQTLRRYRITEIYGDRYGAAWVQESFSKHGIQYTHSEQNRSELYLELLGPLLSGSVELPDDEQLIGQLCSLERRVGAGRDRIDHPRGPGQHDDLSNVVAGAVAEALRVAGGSYGMLDFLANVASGTRTWFGRLTSSTATEPATAVEETAVELTPSGSPRAPEWMPQPTPPCPACKAKCISPLSAIELRCQQCGVQFFRDGVEPPQAYRGPGRSAFVGRGFGTDQFSTSSRSMVPKR